MMSASSTWRTRKTLVRIFQVLLVGLVAIIAFSLGRKSTGKPTVTILDRRVNVLWAKVIKGSDTYYLPAGGNVLGREGLGSRMEGKFRDRVRGWGFGVNTLPAFTPGKGPGGRAFLVSYTFPDPPTSSVHVTAELVADDGGVYPLESKAGGAGGPPERSWNLWALDSLPHGVTNYILRLKPETNGMPLAEIRFPEP